MIRKVYDVDPMLCPQCGGTMKVIAFLTDWAVVDSREERPVTVLAGKRVTLGTLGLAVDGQYLYFTWEESRADVWVADIVQSPDQ